MSDMIRYTCINVFARDRANEVKMKYIVFLGDGMADMPNESLGYKTPLEVAKKPNIDYMAGNGICGLVKTVPDGMKPGSDVANLAVMGFDAEKVYTGRAPLEALSIGINMANDDIAIRCNLVTLSDDDSFNDKVMLDYSAGEITTEEGKELIKAVQEALSTEKYDFYSGVSYRNCLISHGGTVTELTAPHDISGKVIGEYLPSDSELKELIIKSYDILKDHPINLKRIADGKNPANAIWLWGAGTKPSLPSFESLYGLKGAVISAVDLLKGIAIAADMDVIEVDGATGTLETNWDGKATATINALNGEYDYVYLHMEAPDECGHQGDAQGKVKAIEKIDELIGKVLSEVDAENLTVMVAPDHPTPLELKTHTADSVPFIIYRADKEKESGVKIYSEAEATATAIKYDNGMALMSAFIAYGKDNDSSITETNTDENIEILADITGDESPEENVENIDTTTQDDIGDYDTTIADNDKLEDSSDIDEFETENEVDVDDERLNEVDLDGDETVSSSEENQDELIATEDNSVVEIESESISDSINAPSEFDDIEPVDGDDASGEMILDDELPPIDSDETETKPVEEPIPTEENGKKKKKKAKKEKVKKSKTDKANKDKTDNGSKEKAPLTKEQKKKRIIAISVSAVLLTIIIVLSIVLPIVILNKDKIFVSKKEDFDKVNKGKYYVLEKDIVIDGDLNLAKAYTIDMNGHNLTVNGTMVIADTAENANTLNIGTKKGKAFINDGILTATTLKVTYNGNFAMHSMLVTENLEIETLSADLFNAVQVRNSLLVANTTIAIKDGIAFGESGVATIANSTLTISGNAQADYTLESSKIMLGENSSTKSITMDEYSEAHIKGAVDGDITGGAKVVLSKTATAGVLSGMSVLWLHDNAKYASINGNVTVKPIIELVAPPTLSVTMNDSGRIIVNVKTVSNAKRYECTVNGEILPLEIVDNPITIPLITFDITEYAEKHIGEIRIAVRALGAEGDDEELIIPSDYTVINYQHKITLETPKNAVVTESEGNYTLSFNPVNFANKYKIEINGRLAIETAETSIDITPFLDKVGNYSIFVQAVNTDNSSILNSEKALTGTEVRKDLKVDSAALVVEDDGTVELQLTAENAKDMKIRYTNSDGEEITIRLAFTESLNLGKLMSGTKVEIWLIGHGYYDGRDPADSTLDNPVLPHVSLNY